jgi:RNA polymerase sigma factor (sigma-70 family)
VLEVVERALQGERRMSRTLFAPRRLLVDGDTAGRDLLLKDRAVAALAHVRSVEGGVSEPNTLLSAIAETLISIPLPPEKNLVLMGEYKRRYQTAGVESGEGRQTLGLPENNPAEYHEELLFREARYLRIRNYLVMANAGLTHSQSRRFIGGRDDGDDIRQSGFVGLVESVERFDASVGFAFSTSARSWIEKELHDARGKGGEVVSVPRAKRKEFSLYRSAEGDVSKIAALVADGLLAAADVSAFATLTRPVRRLNSPLSQQSEERSLSDIIADDKVAEVDSRLRNDDTRGSVDGLLRELCPTEREIVTLAFGLNGLERHSDAEIAERLNVKKSFVRARKERALHLLQRRARGLEQKHRD